MKYLFILSLLVLSGCTKNRVQGVLIGHAVVMDKDCGVWGDVEIKGTNGLIKIKDVRLEELKSNEEIRKYMGQIVKVETMKELDSCKRKVIHLIRANEISD